MKLKLRILDDAEERDLRERAEAKRASNAQRTRWQLGEWELQQEFSRIAHGGQAVYHLRIQGPGAEALNQELQGLEFFQYTHWYHAGSETIAVQRHNTESAAPSVALIDLREGRIRELAAGKSIVWRSELTGTLLLQRDTEFSTVDLLGQESALVQGHACGLVVEDMLIAYNEGGSRLQLCLADPVLQRVEDQLSSEMISAQLGISFACEVTIRLLHRSEQELCFELLGWEAGRCYLAGRFAVGIAPIALGTIDE